MEIDTVLGAQAYKDSSYDERHWYRKGGWRQMKRFIYRAARPEMPELLDELLNGQTAIERAVLDFIERVARGCQRQSLGRNSTIGGYAISLIGDASALVRLVKTDGVFTGDANKADKDRSRAFGQLFKLFLYQACVKAGGTSANRLANWLKFDRISKAVREDEQSRGIFVDAMSPEHIKRVHAEVLKIYGDDKNLAVELPTLRAYFEEFEDGTHESLDQDEQAEHSASLLEYFQLSKSTEVELAVGQCVNRLAEHNGQDDVDAVLVKYGHHPDVQVPFYKYPAQIGVTPYELQKRFDRGFRFLWNCLHGSLDFVLRRSKT